ncbi:hypothetical protein M2451_001242 [Dysgonomonas sp. PFB1-18]|uniref:hypothetical protein n=1 Tax=unclassified Dysgonomonas TaxID=2630389 RepID=UPI00247689F2|nr:MULTISPECIES: hypothetical protein [unclassified Dysgonomonas]MDH6308676.1 hypothetical protein [Dysgonomonas sp. PF1-14]MDH6338627.1 hypothetical protein [Dysgonomonas sp. PF1-16]MDH6379925.1 hypothetical protein [Dysgonomonas sp. PFB1-18]MDH6397455.1 hypothetical protein [Dysgonomonas sp. PF1-23]
MQAGQRNEIRIFESMILAHFEQFRFAYPFKKKHTSSVTIMLLLSRYPAQYNQITPPFSLSLWYLRDEEVSSDK